jgi:hypothetical protein
VELVHILNYKELPIMIVGDFNIIRSASKGNKIKRLSCWTNLFNAIIEHSGLKEIELSRRNFT